MLSEHAQHAVLPATLTFLPVTRISKWPHCKAIRAPSWCQRIMKAPTKQYSRCSCGAAYHLKECLLISRQHRMHSSRKRAFHFSDTPETLKVHRERANNRGGRTSLSLTPAQLKAPGSPSCLQDCSGFGSPRRRTLRLLLAQ